ncbi:putative RING-type E3 ubiquitin transferase C3H69 isoform X1 [Musa acuminata AAA Group]|uniref:putative RING-type E3 ubiquitin transferase C3H69 isoform X1 n=1 Tax=Musa acuminata AAA Group TaxID=214697 RepID=UPI0031D8E640
MPRRVLCKYFAHGTCLKAEYCEFSHDWRDRSNKACTFYQKGLCIYGSRCRYSHVGDSCHETSDPASSISHHASSSSQVACPFRASLSRETTQAFRIPLNLPASSQSHIRPCEHAQTQKVGADTFLSDESSHVHACIGPGKREEHSMTGQKKNKLLETLKYSQEIECSICLEIVLFKPTDAERKFGMLSECDHPFCISCIRNWRRNSPASGIDLNTALRACPVCRKHSYFVVPSVTWFSTKEEKQEIIDTYKNKLKSIDCKYYDFGNGTCPFGTSCFYKHIYKPSTNRRNTCRPHRYRPHPHRHGQVMEGEELEDVVNQLVMGNELANLAALLDINEGESEDLDDADLGSLLASFLLMQMDDEDSQSDDDNYP